MTDKSAEINTAKASVVQEAPVIPEVPGATDATPVVPGVVSNNLVEDLVRKLTQQPHFPNFCNMHSRRITKQNYHRNRTKVERPSRRRTQPTQGREHTHHGILLQRLWRDMSRRWGVRKPTPPQTHKWNKSLFQTGQKIPLWNALSLRQCLNQQTSGSPQRH